jgi:glycosyltransferase involved in cell wall biosynthesis
MLFSVVIPTHNRVRLLPRTIESIWLQRLTDYEIIVVDDGSTDSTSEYLQTLGDKLRVVSRSNRGPGAARNLGAGEARGDYVAFLDSDDLWFPWTLGVFARAVREHGFPNIVAGRFIDFSDEAELCAVEEESYQASSFPDFLASSRHPFSVGSGTCALRRDALGRIKFLEDRLNAEDHDLILQMGTLPGFVQILSPVTLAWRRHDTSATADLASGASGSLRLLAREGSAAYPGGTERSRERHRILARHIRPTALACVRKGDLRSGWKLYRSVFSWNIELGHWKYLLAFPIIAVLGLLREAAR